MAYCVRCGGYIEPGRGRRAGGLFGKGFICDECNKKDVMQLGGCLLLVLILIVGALTTAIAAYAVRPIAETAGFHAACGTLIAMDAGAVILWFVCRRVKRRTNGFLCRMIARFIGFLALCFAIGSSILVFVGDDTLKTIWGIEVTNT